LSLYHLFYYSSQGVRIISIQRPPGLLIKAIAQPEPGGGGSRPPAQKMGRKISAQMPPANAPAILNFFKLWYTVL